MVPRTPRLNYFISPDKTPVREDHPKWTIPIPLSRHQAGQPLDPTINVSFNHEDYFLAVGDYLKQNRCEIVTDMLSQYLQQHVSLEEIIEININLEKHGEFYHPARIDIVLPGATIPFVLNVAVSESGKNSIQSEYKLLKKLNDDFPFSFVPKVYGQDRIDAKHNLTLHMFIGEWLEGFNEFHISQDLQDQKHKIVVWDPEKGHFFLTTEQALELYKQIAIILTSYYNIETFEQIFPWHHAAGDFVVKLVNNQLDVKLISVRNYVALFKENEVDERNRDAHFLMDALLVFFLNLSIRMRLDRLDGIGNIVWAENIAVKGTLQGFFEGLVLQPPWEGLPETLNNCFQAHLLSLSRNDLLDLCYAMANSYNPKSPEVLVIKRNLNEHVNTLYETIRDDDTGEEWKTLLYDTIFTP